MLRPHTECYSPAGYFTMAPEQDAAVGNICNPASSLLRKGSFACIAMALMFVASSVAMPEMRSVFPDAISQLFATHVLAPQHAATFGPSLSLGGTPGRAADQQSKPRDQISSFSQLLPSSSRQNHVMQSRSDAEHQSGDNRHLQLAASTSDGLASGSSGMNNEDRFTRKAWKMFFPAMVVAIMGKVTILVSDVVRAGRTVLHAHHHHHQDFPSMPSASAAEERKRNYEACKRVAILGVIANLILFVMQTVTGLAGNSAGLIAKAVDSFGDLVGDGVSYLSIKQAHRPPDQQHQFGHGKFESLGALSIATLLLIAAWEAATESLEALQVAREMGSFAGPSMFALYGAAASIVIKEALYRIMMSVGKATNSDSTMANANHHRMDGFASIIVFAGIIGARLGCRYADPVAGVFVAAIIVKASFDIAIEAFNDLTDGVPNFGDMDVDKVLRDAIAESPSVVRYSNLRSRKMGPFIALQFDLLVDPGLTVQQVAEVEEKVKQHVLHAHESITEIGIRILPAVGAPVLTPSPMPALAV